MLSAVTPKQVPAIDKLAARTSFARGLLLDLLDRLERAGLVGASKRYARITLP